MEDDIWTIPEMLNLRSEINSDLKCFTFYDRHGLVVSTLTPRDIYSLSGKFAYLLRTWGFQAGDVIANGLPNSPERVITDFGIIMAGCILTNCQVIEKDGRDFWHTANICQVRGVIIPSRSKTAPHQLFSTYLPPASIRPPPSSTSTNAGSAIYHVTIPKAPSIQSLVVCHRGHPENGNSSLLDNLRAMSDEEFFEYDCLPSDLAILVPTSGSSGFNKLVPSTHEKVLSHGRSYRSSPSLVYFNDRPMGWMGGFPYDFLASGVRRVLQDAFNNQQTKSPSILWGILTSSQCMGAVLTPCDLYPLIDHFMHQPPENKLLFIAAGGQPIKKDLTKALGVLCRCMRVSYGSTEAGVVALDSVSDHNTFEDFYCGVVKVDVQVKIVDSHGNEAIQGARGEIYLKSDRVMQQYYNVIDKSHAPNSPALFSKDGWYKTGDLGMLSEDRKLYCYGRIADVVSLGSTLVYMSWPESILSKCPFIQSSSIVGVETSNGTVLFSAFVVPRTGRSLTPNMVIEFFESQIIDTEYKNKIKLSYIHICDGLPLLPTGKINKRQMKRILRDKFLARCDS